MHEEVNEEFGLNIEQLDMKCDMKILLRKRRNAKDTNREAR